VITSIPARLDALPWSSWHWRVVAALGVTWMLDGLEVTVVGSLGPALQRPDTLGLSDGQIGWAGSAYVGGAVLGALFFGRLADLLGRKKLFLVTLAVYLFATLLTAFSWDFASFVFCRALTGFGIGGEYAAINSAIDELIPARVRGRVSLAINGSFWVGAAAGAGLSLVLLDPAVLPAWAGWRIAFALGALLAFAVLLVRRDLPESPRWLLTHGRIAEAEAVVAAIEAKAGAPGQRCEGFAMQLRPPPSWREIIELLATRYRRRTVLGLALMGSQAFLYNAIFFTYALMLTRFYRVADDRVGLYLFPFALGNVLGPLLLGRFFDTVGRRAMIAACYGLSGLAMLATGYAFVQGWMDAAGQALAWSAIFCFASAAASSAYLTVSEVFPLEMRAVSISIFYAVGTGLGGFAAPALLGALIGSGSRENVFLGYAGAGLLMLLGALAAWVLGVNAERKPLESVAPPLCAAVPDAPTAQSDDSRTPGARSSRA
jgi:MFS family permease